MNSFFHSRNNFRFVARFISLISIWISTFVFAPVTFAVDHSPVWNGSSLTYNLVDLDNFPVLDYGYCKWGVLESEVGGVDPFLQNMVTMGFSQRTAGPFANNNKDLFLSGSTANLSPIDFPSDAAWFPANGSYVSGQVTFTRWPISLPAPLGLDTALFRYLHFSSSQVTTSPDGTQIPLDASTKKLVVLIHGWNPGSDPDG